MASEQEIAELISESRVDAFSLAMDLVGDRNEAEEVVEEVFLRVYYKMQASNDKDIAPLIHRFTYDAALPRLLDRIQRQTEVVDTVARQLIQKKHKGAGSLI